jgi:hypothetical protein
VFQTRRVFNGGSSDIGFATSHDGGATWTHGFLPATTTASTPTGPFFSVSDASIAFDARHGVWLTSWLGLHASGGGVVDVMASRSTDGGLTWSDPVAIAANGVFYDKNWSVCDNTPTSPFYGHCYTEFDLVNTNDLEQMSTSTDGGLTWAPPLPTLDHAHGLGGQPVVQPNGHVASGPSPPTTAACPGTARYASPRSRRTPCRGCAPRRCHRPRSMRPGWYTWCGKTTASNLAARPTTSC